MSSGNTAPFSQPTNSTTYQFHQPTTDTTQTIPSVAIKTIVINSNLRGFSIYVLELHKTIINRNRIFRTEGRKRALVDPKTF